MKLLSVNNGDLYILKIKFTFIPLLNTLTKQLFKNNTIQIKNPPPKTKNKKTRKIQGNAKKIQGNTKKTQRNTKKTQTEKK